MRIVKPYGRSHVEPAATGSTRRVLRLRPPNDKDAKDIEAFARSHEELVIAQWISALDKIATKPSGKDGASDAQRAFRERLGNAAWTLLETKGLLPGLVTRREHLTMLWRAKVHPYGSTPYRPKRGKPAPSLKGRRYERFAGQLEVDKVDAAAIAASIHAHLHGTAVPAVRPGLIATRARSIAENVLRPPQRLPNEERSWSDDDERAYAAAGDVAREIQELAIAIEEDASQRRRGKPLTRSPFALRDAAPALRGQYGRLLVDASGDALPIAQARAAFPGLFGLHMAVRDCYSRILKDHRKSSVVRILPRDMEELLRLVGAKLTNRDLNAMVRLGKVIHYQSSLGVEDSPENVAANWPADVSGSEFWTSAGQAQIKRNEAFVRVWRHVLALAQRTLTDWIDPQGKTQGDILLANPPFNRDAYNRKSDLLFGKRASLFKGVETFENVVLTLARRETAALRHGSFHFKGLGGFTKVLAEVPKTDASVLAAVRTLWEDDLSERAQRLRQTLRGAHVEYFLDEAQGRRLLSAVLADSGPATLPLPRFRRILQRAHNAWAKETDGPGLPEPANRMDIKTYPALHCRYVALKHVYERPFRHWLEQRDAASLNRHIDRAVDRGTKAARDLNAGDDEDRRRIIVARAASLGRLAEDDNVQDFFFELSAETAGEMRVQRGYASDAEAAREQAGYIEDLKCDVLALTFADYLKAAGLDFIRILAPETPRPDNAAYNLDAIEAPEIDTPGEDWQRVLYFILHLVPVEDVGRLLHQTRKWEILAGDETLSPSVRDRLRGIQLALELYLDMHDAKFEGGAALVGTGAFKDLFETARIFDDIFPSQPGSAQTADDERRVPKRGLCEIMRFGHRPALQPIFSRYRVTEREVEEVRAMEWPVDGTSEIARLQDRRERLHKGWTENKSGLSGDDLRAYVAALREVAAHRHLAAHVTLTNHVRLHRLLMAVLGRLVDYSGLWERDLYFVTLALIHRAGRRPADVLPADGLRFLANGQIVEAVRRLEPDLQSRLLDCLGDIDKNGKVRIRNRFAHFNMLQPGNLPVDLTRCVNDARELMAYDRKLRNAVTQSVKELLAREGLMLGWAMGADHRLSAATLATRQAQHLGKTRRGEKGWHERKLRPIPILEDLHGRRFVDMAAALFGGTRLEPERSLLDHPLDRIEWNPTPKNRYGSRPTSGQGRRNVVPR
ncbi:MAG: hypothetical protein FJX54_08055 [Alphaproteobacteria bacterium]|nr:hypothetical protein [Alphaproteobacteria bacterium]